MENFHLKDEIISKVADNTCNQISELVISKLDKLKIRKEMKNYPYFKSVWEGICAQAQCKKTADWESQINIIKSSIWSEAEVLRNELLDSIWLQTGEGMNWDECRSDQDVPRPTKESIIDFILQEFVMPKAESSDNERVKKYLKKESDKKNSYSKKATDTCKKISNKVIRALQQMTDGLEEDTPLKNDWDAVCVQVQGEEWLNWDAYLLTISRLILGELNNIDGNIEEAIWLQTQRGIDWEDDNEDKDYEEKEPMGIDEDDIVEYILRDFVLAKAADWENNRIQEYQYPPGYES
jgi:hypothetical protein